MNSVDGPFQLIHADIADLRFLSISATHPNYCLLAVDDFSSKIYTYPKRQRDLLTKDLKIFMKTFNRIEKKTNADMEFQKKRYKRA